MILPSEKLKVASEREDVEKERESDVEEISGLSELDVVFESVEFCEFFTNETQRNENKIL